MTTYEIHASWGDSYVFHADSSDLSDFGFLVEEAVYVMCEMLPTRCNSYRALAERLLAGVPVVVSYHELEYATLQLIGNQFSLVE